MNIPNHYPELELFTVMGGKFKFQVQDSDLEYLFWRFDKPITLSEKKLTLEAEQFQRGLRCELIIEIDNMKIEEGDSLQMRK